MIIKAPWCLKLRQKIYLPIIIANKQPANYLQIIITKLQKFIVDLEIAVANEK